MLSYETILTTCTYCGCGCGILLEVLDGKIVGTLPQKDHTINQGGLCIKGWNVHEFIYNEGRLRKPLVKKNESFDEISWEEAIEEVANRLKRIKEKYGPDSICGLTSARCTNEENYIFQKWMRAVIGTNNVDHCARLWHSSTVAGLAKSFGSGAMTNSIPELEDSDCILVTGSNTTEAHPLVASRILKAKQKGAKLIVIDPRKTQIAKYADIYVRQRLGTDVAWINGLMHIILKEGWENKEFILERTEGIEELKKELENYPPEKVEEITGIPKDELRTIAETYAKAKKASIVYAMGITQHITGTDNVISLANLAMLTGNIGRVSTGVNPLRGQNNVQGACDMGGLPNIYPGYQSVSDDVIAKKFEESWNAKLSRKPGLTIMEMFQGVEEGKVKAMYIMGENPMVSDPDLHHVENTLKKLELLVVQDIFLTETAKLAHIVLPGVSFAEKEGTFTSTDRRVQRVRRAIEPLGEAKPDHQIICNIAKRMGSEDFDYDSEERIFEEITRLTPIYQGINYKRIDEEGIQWPCKNSEDPGTPFLHKDQFSKGKGTFFPVSYKEPAEKIDEEFPFWLTTGRIGFQYHTRTMTGVSPSLQKEAKEGYIEINPFDAIQLGIEEEEKIKVISRRGEIEIKAKLSFNVGRSIVFIPFHFFESAANVLTNTAFDPVAKIPELKVGAVRLEKIGEVKS